MASASRESISHVQTGAARKPNRCAICVREVRLDAFSYHFYASPEIINPFGELGNAPYPHWRDIFFAQADAFIDQVRFIDFIRSRLA